ncbi:hypothetical protein Goe17_01600 [Bacillus phage vB_BsuM-Goe17]|nr:hypothetical protein Goe17_01600 [Bacillus phage vB_BsuM-Goe17]
MEKTYRVELEMTQRATTTVDVTGEFKDINDPQIDQLAKQKADNLNHDDWDFEDLEFEVLNVTNVNEVEKIKMEDKLSMDIEDITDKLNIAIHFIEVNREELGDVDALNMLLKGIKRVIEGGGTDE